MTFMWEERPTRFRAPCPVGTRPACCEVGPPLFPLEDETVLASA